MSLRTLTLAALLVGGCATTEQVKALEEEVGTLKTRVETLEKSGGERRGRRRGGGPREEAAKKIYEELSDLVAKGQMEPAKAKADELEKNFGSTTTFKRARKMIDELSVVGKPVPDSWKAGIEKWYQGESEVDLMTGTTLIVFWEVWCPHCKREVPELKATYDSFKGKGLDVVGLTKVTRSATEESVLAFVKEQGVTYPLAKENGDLSRDFNVSGIPAAAVVKDGKIIWRGHPARLSDELLNGWLGT